MEAQELNFTASLEKMLGVSKDQIEEIIERLDVDELSNLIDACGKDDIEAVKSIVGVTDEQDESTEKKEEKKDELRGLILRKDDAKKVKSKKHKLQKKELGEEDDTAAVFSIGDEVLVDGEEATVKIPQAPGGTVGVMINGELKMVDKKTSNITKVDEGVLGMTAMPGLNRIKELAGMGRSPEPEDETLGDLDYNEPAPAGALPAPEGGMGDMTDPVDAEFEPVAGPDLGGSDEVGGMGGLGADMGADMAPEVPALPAPPAPVASAPMTPDMSTGAMSNIGSALEDAAALDNAISEIEHMIPNCKISEFKTLVARLQGLVSMAQAAGKAALTESAKKKVMEAKFTNFPPRTGSHPDELDTDDFLNGDDEEDLKPYKKTKKFEEGEECDEDALDTDGDAKAEKDAPKNERKTLLDYVKEAEEADMTLGANPNDAVKALQARMGPKATPQDARNAFDKLRASQVVKQQGASFTMATMNDDDLNAAISADSMQTINKVKPASPNKTSYQSSSSKQSNPAGGGNGYQNR